MAGRKARAAFFEQMRNEGAIAALNEVNVVMCHDDIELVKAFVRRRIVELYDKHAAFVRARKEREART